MSNEQPLACDLTCIEDNELEEHKSNSINVFKSVEDWKELPHGYALQLFAKTFLIEQVGAFISRERLCCPFFNFTLEVTPDHGPVWLKITDDSQEQVKEFVEKNIIAQLESDSNEWEKAENTIE